MDGGGVAGWREGGGGGRGAVAANAPWLPRLVGPDYANLGERCTIWLKSGRQLSTWERQLDPFVFVSCMGGGRDVASCAVAAELVAGSKFAWAAADVVWTNQLPQC